MAKPQKQSLDETKRLMGALVRMKPKPHQEMKLGKRKSPLKPVAHGKASRLKS